MSAPQVIITRRHPRAADITVSLGGGACCLKGGTAYRVSADGEPEEWQAWLRPVLGQWPGITVSCKALTRKGPLSGLGRIVEQLANRDGGWWR